MLVNPETKKQELKRGNWLQGYGVTIRSHFVWYTATILLVLMCKVLRVLHLITVDVNGLSLKGQEPSKRNNKHGLDSRGNNVSTTANVKAQALPNLYGELCVHGQCVTSSVVSACRRVGLLSRCHVVVL